MSNTSPFENPEVQAEFTRLAVGALTDAGFPPDSESIDTTPHGDQISTVAESEAGGAYCTVDSYSFFQSSGDNLLPLQTSSSSLPYHFNGLLVNQEGILPTPDSFEHTPAIELVISSSPARYNQAVKDLGRRPGSNALKMAPTNTSELRAGQLVQGIAQWEMPIPDLSNPTVTLLDLGAARGSSLLALDIPSMRQIVRKAEGLAADPQIDDPVHQQAPEFANFRRSLTSLQAVVGSLMQGVWNASRLTGHTAGIESEKARLATTKRVGTVFEDLGIIPAGLSTAERWQQVETALGRTTANIVKLYRTAEELNPTPDRTQHNLRTRNLGKIAAAFAA